MLEYVVHCGVLRRTLGIVGLTSLCICLSSMWVPLLAHAGDAIERSGDIVATALPAAAFIASLAEKSRTGSWQFVKTVVISQTVVHTLKRIIDRTRPDGGRYSFPSGHTSGAFIGPGFVHLRYGLRYAWPMYIAAGYVGFTRVHSDRHYETDTLAGAAITMLTCIAIVTPYVSHVTATPTISERSVGLTLAIKI